MKVPEHKIKQTMPLARLPAFLRQLADALEGDSRHLPDLLRHLPRPMTKLEIKCKPAEAVWEVKLKIKSDRAAASLPDQTDTVPTAPTRRTGEEPRGRYTSLKKRMQTSFKAIGVSLANRKLPEPDMWRVFLADAERMTAFTGAQYGEACYPAYKQACRELAEAYEARDLKALESCYASLGQLKKDCHRRHK